MINRSDRTNQFLQKKLICPMKSCQSYGRTSFAYELCQCKGKFDLCKGKFNQCSGNFTSAMPGQ